MSPPFPPPQGSSLVVSFQCLTIFLGTDVAGDVLAACHFTGCFCGPITESHGLNMLDGSYFDIQNGRDWPEKNLTCVFLQLH